MYSSEAFRIHENLATIDLEEAFNSSMPYLDNRRVAPPLPLLCQMDIKAREMSLIPREDVTFEKRAELSPHVTTCVGFSCHFLCWL